ncbi:hypothetical protein [Glutamicibacter sp.]|uniref:hypothetical protein n=1 Tax=Glutamicibacter sp. TaxID=1931995 RepID=UPI002FE0BF52
MPEESAIKPIHPEDIQTTLRVLRSVDLFAHKMHTGSGSRSSNTFSTTYSSPLEPAIRYIEDFATMFARITGNNTPTETDPNPGARR